MAVVAGLPPVSAGAMQAETAATLFQVREAIDLTAFPQCQPVLAFQTGPTQLSYSAKCSVTEATAETTRELTGRGWKLLPSTTPATAQYSDSLFSREGFHLRLGVGESGPGESMVTLTSMGNLDMRSLPRMPGASHTEYASAVNAAHHSDRPLAETLGFLSQQMVGAGWQQVVEFQPIPQEVPHFRSAEFRKNAVRVSLGVVLNPQQPDGPVMVYYMAGAAMSMDVPMEDHRVPLRMEISGDRAAFETGMKRSDVVALVQKSAAGFGWKLPAPDGLSRFAAGETPWIVIPENDRLGLFIGLSETGGKTSFSIERMQLPETAAAEAAAAEPPAVVVPVPEMPQIAGLAGEMDSKIRSLADAEIAKALGSLGDQPSSSAKMAELQARAADLIGRMESEAGGTDGETEKETDAVVGEDSEAPSAEDQAVAASFGSMDYRGRRVELKHCLAWVRFENGEPVRCVIFSSQPLREKVLQEKIAARDNVWGHELNEFDAVWVQIRLGEKDSHSLSCYIDGLSVSSSSSEIRSTVRYHGGKLCGQIQTGEMDFDDAVFSFDLRLNQAAIAGKPLKDD